MWSIESNEGFNVGICGSNTLEGLVVFRPFSMRIISDILVCAKNVPRGGLDVGNQPFFPKNHLLIFKRKLNTQILPTQFYLAFVGIGR